MKNIYLIANIDGSSSWIEIDKGEASSKFVDRWGLVARPRAEVCEWCNSHGIKFSFQAAVFQ